MRKYRLIWGMIVSGVFLYMVVGFLTFDLARKKSNEIFPFFSWFLFAEVPQKNSVRYTIRIFRADHRDLEQPLLFSEAGMIVNPKSVSANKLIQDMGRAMEFGDQKGFQQARETLEENQIHSVERYELIRMTYDPVERYQTGKVEMESVGMYERGSR